MSPAEIIVLVLVVVLGPPFLYNVYQEFRDAWKY